MAKLNSWILVTGAAAMLAFASVGFAQQNDSRSDRGDRGGDRGDRSRFRGNFDPAQFQQMMMDRLKERLEVTDAEEWKALQPLVQKVFDTQRAVMGDRLRAFGRGPGGGPPGGDRNGDSNGDRRRGGAFGSSSPEADALQRAIDSKASANELKNALTKYAESRKTHQAQLEAAQAELRKVLTPRQEAIATLNGLL